MSINHIFPRQENKHRSELLRKVPFLIVLSFLLFGWAMSLRAQLLTNDGAVIFIGGGPTAVVYVDGGILNQNGGTIDNSGEIHVTGNWQNDAGNTAFVNSSPGEVLMIGTNQSITGTDLTRFYDLNLDKPGIKAMTLNAEVENILALDSAELATDTNTMFVTNTSAAAVTRAIGFVSSNGNGGLSRQTNSASSYSFPVGSSTGTLRYRPIDIAPASANANTFKVRMANVDPATEGFSPANRDASLCLVNDLYYHRIHRTVGTDSADVTMWFDSLADGGFNGMAHWQNVPEWQNMGTVSTTYNPSPVLSSMTRTGWNDYLLTPFALANVNPSVSLSASSTAICVGDTVSLSASGSFSTYTFFVNSSQVQSGPQNSYSATGLNNSDTLKVTVSDAFSCSGADQQVITVNALPTVNLGADTAACMGNGVTFDAGAGFSSYLWSDNSSGQTLTAATAGIYFVDVTDGNGCQNRDSVTLALNANPTVSLGSDTTFCQGGSTTLDAGNPGSSYLWSDLSSGQTLAVSASGTYYVDVTDSNNCMGSDTVEVTVGQGPNVQIAVQGPGTICDGDTVTLDAGPGSSFLWSPGSQVTQTITVTSSGSHSVVVTDASGCDGMDSVSVLFNPFPGAAFACDTFMTPVVAFTDQTSGTPTTWAWDFGDGGTSATQSPNHTYTSNGSFTVQLIATNQCGNDTMTKVLEITSLALGERLQSGVQVYPNPNNGNMTLRLEGLAGEDVRIEVFDALGKRLMDIPCGTVSGLHTEALNLTGFPKGTYMVKVSLPGAFVVRNVVTQ